VAKNVCAWGCEHLKRAKAPLIEGKREGIRRWGSDIF